MNRKLIAFDLDSTLLHDWYTISDENIKYIKELQKQGHIIVIATGRPYRSSIKFYNQLGLDTPIINYNGSYTISPTDKSFKCVHNTFKYEIVGDIFKTNKEYLENAFCEVKDDIYLYKDNEVLLPLLHIKDDTVVLKGDIDKILKTDPNGFILIAKKDKGSIIENYVHTKYSNELNIRNWGGAHNDILELYTNETDKSISLDVIRQHYNIDRKDVIAFGDGINDIEMIKYANIGIAMNNACDELKEAADVVLNKNNRENGIIEYLSNYFKEQQ